MKRVSYILVTAAVSFLLTGCGIYNKYEQKSDTPADAFGTDASIQAATSDSTIAQMSWREFFTDPLLQELIERVLANNTDLNSARIAVEKSQAALTAAKLAYLPSLAFAPQGTLSSFDKSAAVKTYNLPLQISMDIDVFGSITNKKRAAKAAGSDARGGRTFEPRFHHGSAVFLAAGARPSTGSSHADRQSLERVSPDRTGALGERQGL